MPAQNCRNVVFVVCLGLAPNGHGAAQSVSAAQETLRIERLETLADVWGKLWLFHPNVVTSDVDWESILVRTIPKVERAQRLTNSLDGHCQVNGGRRQLTDGIPIDVTDFHPRSSAMPSGCTIASLRAFAMSRTFSLSVASRCPTKPFDPGAESLDQRMLVLCGGLISKRSIIDS